LQWAIWLRHQSDPQAAIQRIGQFSQPAKEYCLVVFQPRQMGLIIAAFLRYRFLAQAPAQPDITEAIANGGLVVGVDGGMLGPGQPLGHLPSIQSAAS
jgi:hypothetical protein